MQEFIVSTLEDENDSDHNTGDLSLREAIALANQSEGEDTITFDSSLSGGAIDLTETEPNGRGGEFNQDLDITDSVNIIGLGANNLTIDGLSGGNGIFKITGENTNVNLEGLTIANGDYTRLFLNDPLPGGAIDFEGDNLTVKDSVIVGSDSTFGGAINNSGNASIINSTITDSSGVDDSFPGGAIYNTGTLDISNSTISNNRSRGIANGGTLEVNNSTISDNFGGGVFNSNSATVTSSIIAHNTSSEVIFTTVTPGTNTDDDLSGTKAFTSGGNNLIGVVDGFGSSAFDSPSTAGFVNGENDDLVGTSDNPLDPKLGELQDNGGLTLTQKLLEGSPGIDAGSNPNDLATDQRGEGFERTVGNGNDIGAFEVQNINGNPGGGNPHPGAMPTSGDDTLIGTPCNDLLEGLEGNDILIGNSGNDTLDGGIGYDFLQGDDGQDTFVLASGFGTDRIVDFDCGNDLLGLSGEISFADLSFSAHNITLGTETLATFNGFDTANLTESNFIEV